ncbi:transcriptional activator FtrA domain-containing protein [Synechococcus phage Ssp-JY38]|nr:hypothetical protein [Synechococcus phage Yong-L2-223]
MAALTDEKMKQAYADVARANPRWGPRLIKYALHIMPTPLTWIYEKGTRERELAEQHYKARLHAWLVEVNLMQPEQAYQLPEGWVAPWSGERPNARRSRTAPPAERMQRESNAAPANASNEIKRPRESSAGGKAWALCDELYEKHGRTPTPVEAGELAAQRGLNPGNVKTEMSRWRKFNGYSK